MPLALRRPGWTRAVAFIVAGIAFSYALSLGHAPCSATTRCSRARRCCGSA